ncbi:MAG: nucleotidyltransferase family protein [Anaerolineales bacterium]
MEISRILEKNRRRILEIATKHGARNVRVFGSVARGQATTDSDLDLLVELEPGRTLLDHAGLLLDLQDLLGIDVDVVTENGIKKRIRQRVLEEAVKL